MHSKNRVTIVLLAGGRATRLPGKLALPVRGESMLARVFRRLATNGRPCVVSVREEGDAPTAGFTDELRAVNRAPAPTFVADEFADCGPLGGLVSAAARVKTPLLFAAAGDMPNIDAAFVDELEREYDRLAAAGERPDAILPEWPNGDVEPLAALYDTQVLLGAGRRTLESGVRKVSAAFDGINVARYALRPEDEARLRNVNTPEDYRRMRTQRSESLFSAASRVTPGGVNSPVRAFRAVGGTPRFMSRGAGAHVYDVDGTEYVDYVLSWGPLILGHAHPAVVSAIERAVRDGTSFGAPTAYEVELAELIVNAIPSIDMVRFVNSGTEACMTALRLARAFTGRSKIVKCAGCYHGHADALLVAAGSGALTLGIPSSPGVPAAVAADTIVVPYNDANAVGLALDRHANDVACVIVEPLAGNMGFVRPAPDYLSRLRAMTRKAGALLVIDEVMTGFRMHFGAAQQLFDVKGDLTCLGKVIGGGMPVGAVGGRRDVMELLAPVGSVYQAGTLSGNPLAMAAGIATLKQLKDDASAYARMDRTGASLADGLRRAFADAGVAAQIDRMGSMWGLFFNARPVADLESAQTSDTAAFSRFFNAMLDRGVYLAPSQFEAAFLSTAHSNDDVERTLAAARESLGVVAAAAR